MSFWARLDPKVRAGALTFIAGWLLTYFAIPLDPKLEQALNGLVAYAVSYGVPSKPRRRRRRGRAR